MKMLKFTNSNRDRAGDPIYINEDWIVSVYEDQRPEGGSLKTIIYGGPHQTTWNVEEGLTEVIKIINEGK